MFLYIMVAPSYGLNDIVKIGVSKNPDKRLSGARSKYDNGLEIEHAFEMPRERAFHIENLVRLKFRLFRYIGHECFLLKKHDLIDFVKNQMEV